MINGHALVISLMATALVSSRVSAFFTPPLYETLARRYMAPPSPPAAAGSGSAAEAAAHDVPEPLAHAAPANTDTDEASARSDATTDARDDTGGNARTSPREDEDADTPRR
jgi:hypothetical protein